MGNGTVKILVIGGTRLLGLSVVRHLIGGGVPHLVTVLSRRPENCPPAVKCIGMDRSIGLTKLAGESFDIVVDFLAYDGSAVADALAKIPGATYVLISSVWLTRLHPDVSVAQPVPRVDQNVFSHLPAVTGGYLLGKQEAETVVFQARQQGRRATVLRLPIFLGDGDHTGRVEFYRRRSTNNDDAIICVDGGRNIAQVAWSEDIARAFLNWLPFADRHPIWDGLPDGGLSVCDIIAHIVRGTGKPPNLVDVPSVFLEQHLPPYLEFEPLWREVSLTPSEQNIFSATKTTPTPYSKWLGSLRGAPDRSPPDLREKELALVEQLREIKYGGDFWKP
jgi:nucleoside-diphosphate-sugar epimerase